MDQNVENKKEPVTLIDIFAVLIKNWKYIVIPTVLAMIVVVVVCIISLKLPPEKSFMPNKYTPYAEVLISDNENKSGLMNSSGLASIAGLAGVNIKETSTNAYLASYIVGSKSFLDDIIKTYDLVARYKVEKFPVANTRKELLKNLKTTYDEDSCVFSIRFTDIDPVFAKEVVNYALKKLEERFTEMGVDENIVTAKNLEENIDSTYMKIIDLQKQIKALEYSVSNVYSSAGTPSITTDSALLKMELTVQEQLYVELKAQYEKVKVTMESEKPVFQILEYAEVLDKKSAPGRGKICVIVSILAFCFSVLFVFAKELINSVDKKEFLKKIKR